LNPINLLWTGGIDSSYRLLEILLVEGKPVQPYYLVNTYRRSTLIEIQAMETIKKAVSERYPELDNFICHTKLELVSDIPPNFEILEQYERVAANSKIGRQYEWLALFADEHQLFDLELCVTKHTPEGKPCGYCQPCDVRSKSGIEHNVEKRPFTKRALNRLKRLILTKPTTRLEER
jgi:hypothetical protein